LRQIKTLTGKTQFGLVYEKGRSWAARELVIRILPNGLENTRYGLVISRHVGNAVIRNKIKRRLREILREIDLPPGWDIIIIARNPAVDATFTTLGRTVNNLLEKTGMFMRKHEENSPGVD
jgi:ribonuclease P protein component